MAILALALLLAVAPIHAGELLVVLFGWGAAVMIGDGLADLLPNVAPA